MRRSRKSSEKKRRSKVFRRNSRKTNYSRRNYRRKTRKTRKTRKRQMTRKKLRGGMLSGLSGFFGSSDVTAHDAELARLIGMGYDPEEANGALTETNGNIREAVELLLSREPEPELEPEPEPEPEPDPELECKTIFAVYHEKTAGGTSVFKEYTEDMSDKIYLAINAAAQEWKGGSDASIDTIQGEVEVTEPGGEKRVVLFGKPVIDHLRSIWDAAAGDPIKYPYQEEWPPIFQYNPEGRGDYNDVKMIKIARNRNEPQEVPWSVTTAGVARGDLYSPKVTCHKERPRAKNWPQRDVEIKNQRLNFYEVGNPVPRGSSVIDLTGSKIVTGLEPFGTFVSTDHPQITITPNPILNQPTKYGTLFQTLHPDQFFVEEFNGTNRYVGATRTVALDENGQQHFAFKDAAKAEFDHFVNILKSVSSNYPERPFKCPPECLDRSVYRKLTLHYHPDRWRDEPGGDRPAARKAEMTENFTRLQECTKCED
jgi:hypothetical protein